MRVAMEEASLFKVYRQYWSTHGTLRMNSA